jgi:hypothetical protein
VRAFYIEVLATRDGPELCVGCPRGRRRSVGRGTRRLGYRAAKSVFQGADVVERGGRQHRRRRFRESLAVLRGRRACAWKAPDNRHGEGNGESYIEDPASHGGPDHALATREGAAKRWIGVHAGRDMEPRNGSCPGCRRAHARRKATPPVALLRVAGGSRGVEEPEQACDLFMLRTGRSRGRPCLSLMPRPGWFGGWRVGGRRAARGRLRP